MGVNIGRRDIVSINSTDDSYDLEIRAGAGGLEDFLKASFSAGSSFSFSKSVTYSEAHGQSKPLKKGECGYWTFIPRLIE